MKNKRESVKKLWESNLDENPESSRMPLIREARKEDAEAFCEIYNHYVENSVITFEKQAVTIAEMQNRIQDISASLPWLVYEDHGIIQGYTYASNWKSRCAYRFSVESTVYLDKTLVSKGIGRQLYEALIHHLRDLSLHSVIGGIALPNSASVALHEKMGFSKVAHFKEVGWKMNRWVDVGYWELIIQNTE